MTARVINDPSSLGWEYDPETGRWSWGGGSSSGGGGDGTTEVLVYPDRYSASNSDVLAFCNGIDSGVGASSTWYS